MEEMISATSIVLMRAGKTDIAMELLDIAHDKFKYGYYIEKGLIFLLEDNLDKAIKEWSKEEYSILLAQKFMALAYYLKGEIEKVRELTERLPDGLIYDDLYEISHEKSDENKFEARTRLHYYLASLFLFLGNEEKFKKHLEILDKRDQYKFLKQLKMGLVPFTDENIKTIFLYETGYYDEALKGFARLLKEGGKLDKCDLYFNMMLTAIKLNRLKLAEKIADLSVLKCRDVETLLLALNVYLKNLKINKCQKVVDKLKMLGKDEIMEDVKYAIRKRIIFLDNFYIRVPKVTITIETITIDMRKMTPRLAVISRISEMV